MYSALSIFSATLAAPPPWLRPYAKIAQEIWRGGVARPIRDALNSARDATGCEVRFVEHTALPANEPYEAFIARTSCVPTRDNLHDLFNGIMWLSYPRTKGRLNSRQAQEIAARGITGARGPLRDALTLFDENGAVFAAPNVLVEALREREWKRLFVEQREAWGAARCAVFGHALMEKLMQPRKAITAHVLIVADTSDEGIAAAVDAQQLSPKSFLPLPLLGIPGWWSANEDARFYEDAAVFRPPR